MDAAEAPAGGIEWPTLTLLAATYGLWAVATTWGAALWLPLGVGLLAVALAQLSSLQHEVLHGHPFRSRRLNEALVFPALGLLIPYGRFRDLHLAHHNDALLTDPYDDPESKYLDPAVWARLPGWMQGLLRINNTLLGRMVLGPALGQVALMRADWAAIRRGTPGVAAAWGWHAAGLVPVALWLGWVAAMPVWAYALGAYLAMSLLKIRTFCEHRAHERASGRTVVIEDRGPLALLFLNNNLHVVHHMHPNVPWYRLPAMYAARKAHYLRRNDGYVYPSYAEVFRQHFLRAKDPVPHPLWPQGDGRQG